MIPLSAALGFKSWEVQTAATRALGSQVIGGCLLSRETLLNIPKMSRSHSPRLLVSFLTCCGSGHRGGAARLAGMWEK